MKVTMTRQLGVSAVLLGVLWPAAASLAGEREPNHAPDPLAVQRFDKGYRYPQAGWIVLHIEGKPYERGVQHGRLLAPEIAGFVRAFAEQQSHRAPEDGWQATRTLVNALFLRRFEPEYLEEMKGIADGAAAVGAKFGSRPIDLIDIAAVNCWAEVETLDGALHATPTGLEGRRFPGDSPQKMPEPPMGHCSAFAATGPATADGKIVFGHITMFGLYASNFFNVWLDVKPSCGQRVLMQTFPGGIQSGMDYYMNDAGLLVSETTIKQTRFNKDGMTLASRIRKALQYSESIEELTEHLTKDNNGLYTNEWLIGDTKTNEIAMLQLGTGKFKLSRSSKNEWYGGTEGFYWGCNNTKDLELRLEAIAATNDRPENLVWRPSDRDKLWQRLYHEHKGKIDAGFGRLAFTTPPLAAYHSLDAKFTTTDMAKELKTYALFGPPLGLTWLPTDEEKKNYPPIRPLVSHPWTILTAAPPGRPDSRRESHVVDLPGKVGDVPTAAGASTDHVETVAAWRGTIHAKTDGDIWLAAAFAEYERIVALEKALRKRSSDGKLSDADRERLAVQLNNYRVEFTGPGESSLGYSPVALSKIKRVDGDDRWYRQAVGKGVCVLHELRAKLTPPVFDPAMDSFGTHHAGQEVTTAEFRAHMEKQSKKELKDFFERFVENDDVSISDPKNGRDATRLVSDAAKSNGHSELPASIPERSPRTSNAGGRQFTVHSFRSDLEHTLIVYGTKDDEAANRDAALELQRTLRLGPNITVPVKADRDVRDADLSNHILLVGRPETNGLERQLLGNSAPVAASKTFEVRGNIYANSHSAVIYALRNSRDPNKSVVVVGGLSAEATRRAAVRFTSVTNSGANVVILPGHTDTVRNLVVNAKESGPREPVKEGKSAEP
jgi:hypothetical protein